MTRNQILSSVTQFLSNDEILKALNAVLNYLKNRDSYLEPKFSDLKNKYIRLQQDHINNPSGHYLDDIEKLKANIRLYVQDLPEFDDSEPIPPPAAPDIRITNPDDTPNTLFALIWKFLRNPVAISIVVGLILVAYILIRLSGRDPLCLLFKDCNVATDTVHIISSKTWAEAQSEKDKKPYALLSVIEHITFEDIVENGKKIRKALYRNTYTLRALKDIAIQDNIFLEEFSTSTYPNPIEEWAGSENQEIQSVADKKFWVRFSAKKNEIRTIITGANYKYLVPLAESSNNATCFQIPNLPKDDWLVCYPNDVDYIDHLTILLETQNIKLIPIGNSAYRKNAIPPTNDASCHQYPNGSEKCTMVATWEDIKPGECVGLRIKWELPK